MFNDDVPSYLAQSPTQKQEQPSYLDFPKENTSGSIQPPTTQPSLENYHIDLPQVDSPKEVLPYSYRAGVSTIGSYFVLEKNKDFKKFKLWQKIIVWSAIYKVSVESFGFIGRKIDGE